MNRRRETTRERRRDEAPERTSDGAAGAGSLLARWRASDGRWGVGLTAAAFVSMAMTTPADAPGQVGGAALQMGVLAAVVAWGFWALTAVRGAWRFELLDGALLVLLVWIGASAWRMSGDGCPRLTWNAFWTWGSAAAAFWLARRFLRTAADCRALVAVMLAAAVVQSSLGLYQSLYARPRDRAIYWANPELALAEAGIIAPKDSPLRAQFESRMQDTEPLGTFSLTNSLAGLLAPWVTLSLGVTLAEFSARRGGRTRVVRGVLAGVVGDEPGGGSAWPVGRLALLGTAALVVVVCLLLTKSRSAYLATLGGAVLVALVLARGRWRIPASWWGAAAGVTALLVGAATWFGLLDKQVLTEARMSLGVRWEYWQSTWAMLGDHPWWGCGAGNYQNYYAAYKLPQASEMVADPHNWFFEMSANAGWPAGAWLAGLLFVVVVRILGPSLWGRTLSVGDADLPDSELNGAVTKANEWASNGEDAEADRVRSGRWGAVGWGVGLMSGVFAAFLSQYFPDSFLLLAAIPLGSATLWLLQGWVVRGRLPAWCVGVALVVLIVNLSAAGSLAFGGVVGTLWLLVAIGWRLHDLEGSSSAAATQRQDASASEGANDARVGVPVRWNAACALAVAVASLAACLATSFRPVTLAGTELQIGGDLQRRGMFEPAENAYREAARLDPWSPDAWQRLAELQAMRFGAVGPGAARDAAWSDMNESLDATFRLNRRAYGPRRQLAELLLGLWRRTNDERALRRADELLSEALKLYPRSNILRAQRAWTRHLAGRHDESRADAAEAMRLDDLSSHSEQKLAAQRISDSVSSFAEQPRPPLGESAAETMRRLTTPATSE